MDNSAEAKPPNNENDWQAIDIYVFFNGQQYSPPRKYHLSADELNWWDATLSNLAKSLFGLTYPNIYLYTTDGRKIEGPLELKDGMAYVAVEPSDTFIDAGYDKYLIRATRSWEKRQAKKAGPIDVTEPAKQGCDHDQPCCLCAEKEDIVTVESERSVMVATEISTLRAPDEIYADSVLGKTGQNGPWVGTFDPRTGEYNIAPVERGTINDCGTRFNGKCPRSGERRSPGEYARLPGEYGRTLAEQGIMPADYGRIPADERLKPAEYRRTPVEIKQASGERGPGEQAQIQSEYEPIPVKQSSNLGDYDNNTVDQRITNGYGRSPAEQVRTPGEFRRAPVDQLCAPNEYLQGEQSRSIGESEHSTGQLGRIRGVYKRPTDEKIRTLGEIGYVPGKQGGTPGEYQYPSGGQDIVSVDYERAPVEQGRTPSVNRRSPGELDQGSSEYDHTAIDQGRSPSENGRLQSNQGLTSGNYERPTREQVPTAGESGRIPVDQSRPTREQVRTSGEGGRISVDQGRPPGEQVRTSGESGRTPTNQQRNSSGYGRPQGEKARSLGESGNAPHEQGGIPGEIRCSQGCGACRRPKGEQIRSLGENGRAPGEQGGIPSEYGPQPGVQNHASGVYGPGGQGRTLGEHGRTPVDQGRNPVEQCRTTGENKRISGDRGRTTGGQNRNTGEYGRTAVDQGGRTQNEFGRSQGQQGRDRGRTSGEYRNSGEQGRIPGENGRTPGENGRTTGNYVRKPGDRGRLSGENARTSVDNRRPPVDYRTNEQKRLSNEQGRTSNERGRTLGARGRTFGPQGRIAGEYERLPTGLETRNDDQPVILSDYYPSPEESGSKVRGKPEIILSDNINRTGESTSRSNEPGLRLLEQEDRLGENGSRVSGIGSRGPDIGSRVGEQGGQTNDYQSRPVDRGGKLGEPVNKMGEVITDRGIGYGGRLGELPEKEIEYVTMPGGQGTMAELDGEQEDNRAYNGGRQGELEARGGDLVTRLTDQARLSGGGANGTTGYSYVTETQHIRKSSMTSSVPKNASGTVDNKRRWAGAAHTTFKRPSPIPVSPASQRRPDDRRTVRNSREENKKIVLKSPARSSNGATAAPNVAGKQKVVPKCPYKRFAAPSNPIPASSFDQNIIKGKATSLTKIVSNHKSLTTDSAAVENIIGDKEIIFVSTNLFRNQESEITSVRLDSAGKPVLACIRGSEENHPEINRRPQSNTSIPVNEEVQTCTEEITEEIHGDRHGGSSSRHLTRTSSKTKVIRPASGPRLNMVAGDATPDENYIAIINKGDVVNLKLNIEVRSGDKTDLNHKSARSRSLTNVARTEIGSQISIDEDLVAQSKSLQSLLNNEFRGTGFEGRPKVVVVQCACCGMRPNNPTRCDPTPSENKKYFVLMPSSQQVNATVEKCDCNPALKQIYDQRVPPQIKKQSISLPLKKTYSATSIEAVTVREGSSPFPRREVGLFMATTTTNSACHNEAGRLECPAPRPRVSITENQIPRCNSVRRSSSQISMTHNGYVARRSTSNSRACQNLNDSSTQTEWCSVLLEARRHEDGRYSFHLPPLQVLRYYSCS